MRFFESAEAIARLERRVAESDVAAGLELAWYLRLSQPGRVRALLVLLDDGDAAPRALLIAAEHAFFAGDLARAGVLCSDVLARAASAGDAVLEADGGHLWARLCAARGDFAARDAALGRALAAAREAADEDRALLCELQMARNLALGDAPAAARQWGERFAEVPGHAHAAVQAATASFLGVLHHNLGDVTAGIAATQRAFSLQAAIGQIPAAVVSACNLAEAYGLLNAHDAGLEWAQQALELARELDWADCLASSLQRVGECLRAIGRIDEAQVALSEALRLMGEYSLSRNYLNLLRALGDTARSAGEASVALDYFTRQAEGARLGGQSDLWVSGCLGRAAALLDLRRVDEAEVCADEGLMRAQAQGLRVRQVALLAQLAKVEMLRQRPLAALARLDAALAVAAEIDGYIAPAEIFSQRADAYAACGDFPAAYAAEREATQARARMGDKEAQDRATLLRVRVESERARAEAERERVRADLLERTTLTLERLGAIGQEITAQLDQRKVFEALHRHVHALLDAQSMAVFLLTPDGTRLVPAFGVETGGEAPAPTVLLSSPVSYCARCVRERCEMLIDFAPDEPNPAHVPGTAVTLSALYAPLLIGERVLGAMTIQSVHARAYGEPERMIFRTLCAYAAIALDNAVAYARLRETQEQLVAHEKMAALGALVAGVAHELNTPIGNSLLVASAGGERCAEAAALLADGRLGRARLEAHFTESRQAFELIGRSMRSAAALVGSFKEVAVDRATEQRRCFSLRRTSEDVVATLARRIAKAGHRLELAIAEEIEIDGYPGPYGQVLNNLVENAIVHGFGDRSGGTMRLRAAACGADEIELVFSDDGAGIAAEHLRRVFDPFFTTKLGRGGSGLGLSISFNIATALFGGQLNVDSAPGQGARFTWRFPRVAPQQPAVASTPV